MMLELRSALRSLQRSPGFTIAAISTLALAAGAVIAVLAVVSRVLLAPLPVRDQEDVVVVWKRDAASGVEHWPFTYPAVRALAGQLTTAAAVGTVDYNGARPLSVVEGDQGVTILTGIISGEVMPLLGVQPILGRPILPADDIVGAPRVAVISEAWWKTRFASAPDILQRTIRMYDEPYEIVGVVKGGFGLPSGAVMWIAQKPFQPDLVESDLYPMADLVVRLTPGVSIEQFRTELELVRSRTPNETFAWYKDHRVVITPLHDFMVSEARPTLLVLAGGVSILLIVAAANLGGLFLVRSGSRIHEVAVRSAIGGGTVRSLRTIVTEFVSTVVLGAVVGMPVGWALLKLLSPLLPPELPVEGGIALHAVPLFLGTAGALIAGLAGGAAPVFALSRADLITALRAGGRSAATGWGMHPIRRVMVAAQIALAVVMVAGSGLLIRTLERMHRIEPGFESEGVLFFDLADSRRYDSLVAPKRTEIDRLIARLERVPGVTSASAVVSPPFAGNDAYYAKFIPVGMSAEEHARLPYANTDVVSPAAHRTLGLRLVDGRFIEAGDREETQMVVVFNETMARTLFPGGDAIGKFVHPPTPQDTARRALVVGIVSDTRYNELLRAVPMAYLSYRQIDWIPQSFIVRATSDAAVRNLVPQLRAAVQEELPAVAIRRAVPMSEMLAQPLARPRLAAVLVGGFAFMALALAAIGIYSVMASFVVQRTREIGVRMALGATRQRVQGLVFRQGMVLTAIGLSVGLAVALLSGRLLDSLLYEVPATDPLTFVAVAVLLLGVAALAVLLPSMRAARLEPVEALRAE